jgi:hypothetical protein
MSDASLEEPASTSTPTGHLPSFPRWLKSPLVIALAALTIALLAAAAATAAWLRPAHEGASHSFNGQQSAEAKKNVCSAYGTIRKAVSEKTPNPRPDDPLAKLEVITNRQLVLLAGSVHLRETLAAQPAAQADLTKAVSNVANTLEHLAINNLAGIGKQAQSQLWKNFGSEAAQINNLCK